MVSLVQRSKGPLAPREQRALAAVCVGTVFIGARLAKQGLLGLRGGTCQLCDDAAGTLLHRMLYCPTPSVSAWPSMPGWLRAPVQAAGLDEVPLALLRLWWAPPSETVERSQLGPRREDSFALRYVSSEGDAAAPMFCPEHGPVFTDG